MFNRAYRLLSAATIQGEDLSPLRGPTSCSLHDRVYDDAIILVTGDLPAPDQSGAFPRMRRLATHLLATVGVRRVWEGIQSEAPSACDSEWGDKPHIYPVVLDDVRRLSPTNPTSSQNCSTTEPLQTRRSRSSGTDARRASSARTCRRA